MCVWLCGSWWVVVAWVWAGGWVVCVWCWGGGYVAQETETATATAVTRQKCGEWCAGRRRRNFWLILAYLEHNNNQKARQIVIYFLYPTISDYIRLYPTISDISHHIPPYRNWDIPKIHSSGGLERALGQRHGRVPVVESEPRALATPRPLQRAGVRHEEEHLLTPRLEKIPPGFGLVGIIIRDRNNFSARAKGQQPASSFRAACGSACGEYYE